ncbi:MAG: DUF1841 family protein [Candidatus Aminicenantes bacterium]|jgi:hypothetical protein
MNEPCSLININDKGDRRNLFWVKAKAGDYKDVSDEEIQMMNIMLEHEDEYSEIFENAHLLSDDEFGPDSEGNPFMHITIHSIIENQLELRDPIEVYQFYLAMLKKKCPRHEVIHYSDISKTRGQYVNENYNKKFQMF